MEDINKEKKIKNAIEPVSIEKTEKIINQMKNSVCKIYSNGSKGTGFFTKIPYKNKIIKVLITNNHILDENEIKNDNIITYIINNNEKDKKRIKIDDKRIRYTNKELDVTIIEINEDEDNIHNYIELDDDIIDNMKLSKEEIIKNYKNIYKNESIYILNYMNGENILVSYGLIAEINEGSGINHKCNTDDGSSGSPILSLKNNKLIGIHYGSSNKYEYNLGTLIIYAMIELNNIENKININKNQNEITDKNDKRIELFGKKFIEKKKNNCKTILDFIDEIKSSKNNIVLIGSVGVGKTTFLNKICGVAFKTSDGGYSCTKNIQYSFSIVCDLIIIDFPGLKATRDVGSHLKTQVTALKNLSVKMICLMIQYSTRNDDFERELSEMLGIFDKYIKNITIIITKCEGISSTRQEDIKYIFKTGFKIENVIFSSLKKNSYSLINELNDIQKTMKNIDRVSINTRKFAENIPSLYNPKLKEEREMYEYDFNNTLFKFNQELDKATDNNLRRALYFCFKNYKESLLFQYKACLDQKRIEGKEVDLNVIISEVLLLGNKIYDKFEEFKKKVKSKMECNKFKKCPHCGIIWFKDNSCDSIVCGRRTKIRDSICGRSSESDSKNYGEDNEFYGLTKEEIEKNNIREKEGKVKIKPIGCGQSLSWNQMEDVSEQVLNILKREINHDNVDYYN